MMQKIKDLKTETEAFQARSEAKEAEFTRTQQSLNQELEGLKEETERLKKVAIEERTRLQAELTTKKLN